MQCLLGPAGHVTAIRAICASYCSNRRALAEADTLQQVLTQNTTTYLTFLDFHYLLMDLWPTLPQVCFLALLSPHPQYIHLSLCWHSSILFIFIFFFHTQWHFLEHFSPKCLCKYRVVSFHFKKIVWNISAITQNSCLEHDLHALRLQAPICTALCHLSSN